MKCPVCENNNSAVKFKIGSYQIMDCLSCNHRFTGLKLNSEEVKNVYSDNYFFGGMDGYPDYTLEKYMLIARGEKYADIAGRFMKPGTLLDVGAAAGFIMKGFENKGWKVSGVEPNSSMVSYGKETLGLEIKFGTLEDAVIGMKVDLVLLIQVIAHLFNLKMSMEVIHQVLKTGGYVLVETWNKDSIMARLLGRHWHEYSPPSTLNYFSKRTLDMLMRNYGFKKISGGKPGKKIHSKHAKSLLQHKLKNSNKFKWMRGIEKLIPSNKYLTYPAEDLFWALYKKTN